MAAPDLLLRSNVVGIDTHKFMHVAALLDGLGRNVSTLAFAATDHGTAELLAWFDIHGAPVSAGIEGTGSYGYQLTRAVQAAGIIVHEVNRPDRANRRRRAKATRSTPRPPPAQCCPDRRPRFPRTAKVPWNPYDH